MTATPVLRRLLLAGSAAALLSVDGASGKPPANVIVILCDDLGYGELPVYRRLYQHSQELETSIGSFTPNLDRLAKEGVVCTRAYGNNTCAPARMSLLSGKWPNRAVTLGGQPMIGRVMRQAGLKTAHYGKYHHEVEKEISIPCHADFLEFDEFMGFEAATNYFRKAGEVIKPLENAPITYRVGEKVLDYQFPAKGVYLTDKLTEHGVDFIKRCAMGKRPLFLYLPYNAPHTPIQAKPEDLKTLFPKRAGNANTRQKIMAMVYAVDRGIGRLMETLRQHGQLEQTLLVFAGDNGGEGGLSLTYPLHGFKHEPFDGGIRVPFIVWSKSLQFSERKPDYYDGLVSLCDILPTALKYVNPAADLGSLKLDGADLMPHLKGEKPPLTGRRYLNTRELNHRSNTWDGGRDTQGVTTGTCFALLVDNHKIMRLTQDAKRKDEYSYQLQHLPNMIGKPEPRASLVEGYYDDNVSDPETKKALIEELEQLLSRDW